MEESEFGLMAGSDRLSTLGLSILGLAPLGFAVVEATEAEPFVFENELALWLADKLGIGCFPSQLPQGDFDYPLLTYTVIDGDSGMRLARTAGIGWKNIQFDAWSQSAYEAQRLQAQLFTTLGGYRGRAGIAVIRSATPGRALTSYEITGDGSDQGYHRSMREYKIWFVEPRKHDF